ncbi:cyclic nucleotide-binding domain-containing protein [Shewanella sp. 202IG2-18]|uniref:cyclic nucleotide-binding domain-containing protein n=1 Tax=Parashewanella hymeniacidonis TaxID=2807618 RepID=UPI001961574E|nr:cyclic nucleotide-binding domain-containing protein [Parashewanella hymeniacidonis]
MIHQSEKLDCLYFLLHEKLKVSSYSDLGEEVVLWIESGFTVVGELELFLNESEYSSISVSAISDSVMISIPVNMARLYCLNDQRFL